MIYSKQFFLFLFHLNFLILCFSSRLFILEYLQPCKNNLELPIRFEFIRPHNERNISIVSGVMNITEQINGPNFAVKSTLIRLSNRFFTFKYFITA